MQAFRTRFVSVSIALGLLVVACGSSSDTDSSMTPDGGGGGGNSLGGGGGTDASTSDAACAQSTVTATIVKKPVDIVLVVDTSSTMKPASTAVEENVNMNLAQVLTTNSLDYRIIVLAGYGDGAKLCVAPPLGGASCSPPPAKPANTTTFFQYGAETGSGGLLENIVQWYSAADPYGLAPTGWSSWLRKDALKVFVAFSDTSSGSTIDGSTFDTQLLALSADNFGTAAARNYVFHSIIGLAENSPATAPWLPSDPVVTGKCSGYDGSLGSGPALQNVSILTGGLRFPICQFASFDVVFKEIAKNVIARVPIACDLPLPAAPSGSTIDPDTVQLDFTPTDGSAPSKLVQVKDEAACTPQSFWSDADGIHLCPDACGAVNAKGGNLSVRFGCDVGFVK